MAAESVTASTTIDATPEEVFAVLADPATHAEVDGTGWVRAAGDVERLTAAGQVFRMAMYHPDHPDGDYETANLIEAIRAEAPADPYVTLMADPPGRALYAKHGFVETAPHSVGMVLDG